MKILVCLKESEPNSPNMNTANYDEYMTESLIWEVVSRHNLIKKYFKILLEREGNCQITCTILIILINLIIFVFAMKDG